MFNYYYYKQANSYCAHECPQHFTDSYMHHMHTCMTLYACMVLWYVVNKEIVLHDIMSWNISSLVTQALGGKERRAWYQLRAHALNFPRFWGKLDIYRQE